MGKDQPLGTGGIRARRVKQAWGETCPSLFRIKDEAGRVLHKVKGARDPQEAMALYWRRSGSASLAQAGLGAAMTKDLERRIRQARAGSGRTDMQTPQLPFETAPAEPGRDEAGRDEAETGIHRSPRRGRPPRAAVPQIDLFGGPGDAADPAPVPMALEVAPEPSPIVIEARPGPGPEVTPEPEPYALDAHEIGLIQVDARNLRPTDRADNYLYHITNGPDAEGALRTGLLVSASDPIILTERQGVAYWLSVLADDYDYILDGPADFVVLRLRRMAVEMLLEHDQHASRSAGCPCFLLTGGASLRDPP